MTIPDGLTDRRRRLWDAALAIQAGDPAAIVSIEELWDTARMNLGTLRREVLAMEDAGLWPFPRPGRGGFAEHRRYELTCPDPEPDLTLPQSRVIRTIRTILSERRPVTEYRIHARLRCGITWAAHRLAELEALGYSWPVPRASTAPSQSIERDREMIEAHRLEFAAEMALRESHAPRVHHDRPSEPTAAEACRDMIREWKRIVRRARRRRLQEVAR